jgi:Dolichyl-phosphate-mannose-protein mannosyltransferase
VIDPGVAARPRGQALRLAALLVLLAVAFALRLVPIRHGSPRNYVPDTHMVRQSLAMARDHDLAPRAGQYSFYPNLLPYLLLPVYGGEYALGKARGVWPDAKGFGEHLLDHPEDAEIPARVLVAVFGALTCLVVLGVARAAGLGSGAWVAAWLSATSLLSVQLSTQERPWIPMTFFLALACWPAVLYARDGRGSRLVASGFAAGLAAACHQGGLLALAIPGLAWLLGPLEWRGGDLRRRFGQGVAAVGIFLAAALVLGYPHFARYGFGAVKVAGGADVVEQEGGIHVGGLSVVFGVRWRSFTHLARSIVGYDPVVVALGLGGASLAFARRELRAALCFAAGWAAFFMTNRSDHVRYLLPVITILAWPAGLLAESMLARGWSRILLGALLALPLVQAARLACLLPREDTRAEAERRLAELGPGTEVAIDRYGPQVDLSRESLELLLRLRTSLGETLRERENRRRLRLDAADAQPPNEPKPERGVGAVSVEELFDADPETGGLRARKGLEKLGDAPKKILDAVGATHFLLVERHPSEAEDSPFRALARRGKPVWVIDPARGFGPPDEAYLPTEMEFPLTALWRVDRPGPYLELRDLR